jgi:CRP/FNR family transcriptional regulator, cyclic AMP receptor protein
VSQLATESLSQGTGVETGIGTTRLAGAGEIIYQPGDRADQIHLIRRGSVRLERGGRGGRGELTALLSSGEIFGDLLAPEGTTIDERAIAMKATEIWSTDGRGLQTILTTNPGAAMEIFAAYAWRLRQMRRRLLALTSSEVPVRLADLLILLGETNGQRCAHGGDLDLRGISQQDLADLVGASRSFVSTLINEFKRQGVLANYGRTLCVQDLSGLRRLATS